MLSLLFFLLAFSSTFSSVLIKNTHHNDFEYRYTLTDQTLNKTNHLIISCKQSNLLSLMILPQGATEEQLPSYPIFRPHQEHGLNRKYYTFFNNCRVDIQVEGQESIVKIKRKNSSQVLFEIKTASFNPGHRLIETVDNSQIFGFGQRFQQHFDVRDGHWTLWNRDRPWEIDSGSSTRAAQTYGFHPLYLARQKNSKLFHITYFRTVHAMNVVKKQQKITYHVVDGNVHFLIFIGKEKPEELLKEYHQFIGPSLIHPFWSMGYHQCRWGYKSVGDLQHIIQMHDKHEVPLDVVWNDLDYMHQKQDFTVDEYNYPLDRMRQNVLSKVHYIPLIDAGISIHQLQAYKKGNQLDVFMKLDGKNYIATVWPGLTSFVDFLHPNASKYWNMMFNELYQKIKFSGIWIDMNQVSNFNGNAMTNQTFRVQYNELLTMMTADLRCTHFNKKNFIRPFSHGQVHNYYGHLMVEATNKFLMSKNLRPFIITRANSVGTGVYGAHWTGDNVANWKFLYLSISGNFLYQIFGIPMVGSDICGFHLDTTQQLCSRWMQLGAFYPFARNHNQQKFRGQEVYALGDKHLQTSKAALDLRYSLLKQYYSAFVKNQGKGSIYRPLFFEFPNDEQCYQTDVMEEQFIIGDFLMGTPIVHQSQTQKIAYFPEGWYDFYQGNFISGKSTVKNILPDPPSIYVREGKTIFVNQAKTRTKNLDSNFMVKVGLKKQEKGYSSEGYIMSINDYQNNNELEECIKNGCFYNVRISSQNLKEIRVSWEYKGQRGLNKEIKITQIQVFSNDGKAIKSKVSISLQKQRGSVLVNV